MRWKLYFYCKGRIISRKLQTISAVQITKLAHELEILYFCNMKRFLIYCLVAVSLFVGVNSTSMLRSERVLDQTSSTTHKQTIPEHQHSYLSATDALVSIGMRNEQVRLTNLLQCFSCRVTTSLTNAFRVSYLQQIALLRYFKFDSVFSLSSAFKQLDGYYLYHLCKLLIWFPESFSYCSVRTLFQKLIN